MANTRVLALLAALLSPALPALGETAGGPLPPKSAITESHCDTLLADPFRPMENLEDPGVLAWIRHASSEARRTLEQIPGRSGLVDMMVAFDRRSKAKAYGLAITDNDRYFYLKRTPEDEAGKLYTRNGFTGKEHLLFDPASLSASEDEHWVVSQATPSDDGSRVAILVAANGSEDNMLLIMDTETRSIFPERIDRCRFAIPSWLPDGKGFLYTRMRKPGGEGKNLQYDSQSFLHIVGTDPADDREVFSREGSPLLGIDASDIPVVICDKESHTLFAFVSNVDRRLEVFRAGIDELEGQRIKWQPFLRRADNVYDFAVRENDLYLLTPEGAPRFRLLKTSFATPDMHSAETLVEESPDELLTAFALTSEAIYFTRTRNGVEAKCLRLGYGDKAPENLTLPFPAGSIHLSTKGVAFRDAWIIIAGWANDYRRYRYEEPRERFVLETISSPAEFPEYRNLVVEEVMVPSHDGTLVPLSIIRDRSIRLDGKNPALLYGYGAYGHSITPFFSPGMLLWTRHGGVLAFAHVRGGGELGSQWHNKGMKENKPNTWKDLIASSEYLIKQQYTRKGRIAINGASAGGILVGMAMIERPELFAAAIPQVGAMNPLRSEETPNGPVNVPEFGSIQDKAECRALLAMDPYMNLKDGVDYPAALITAGMNDPRVIAWQPAKFAARLQEATASGRPVLFFADEDAGHGMGNIKSKEFETLADVLSFALWQTGAEGFQPKEDGT